jgi:hypothetical protein
MVSVSGACWWLLRVARQALLLIPVYLVVALIAVDWYVFVIQWAFGKEHDNKAAVALLVRHHNCTADRRQQRSNSDAV